MLYPFELRAQSSLEVDLRCECWSHLPHLARPQYRIASALLPADDAGREKTTGNPHQKYHFIGISGTKRRTYTSAYENGGLMLYWALMFLLVAIIAAVFGFTGIAIAAAGIAKLLFFIFLVLFVIALASHLMRGRV